MPTSPHFSPALFGFLRRLGRNNNREWFQANKPAYERDVRDPLLRFIADFAPHLKRISPHFVADPKPVGGSMFRIYRDTRFSRDKRPYKTVASAQFRHEQGKDAHAPGFYHRTGRPCAPYAMRSSTRPRTGSERRRPRPSGRDSTWQVSH